MSTQDEKVAKVIQKARKDQAFKAALLKDPNAAVEKELKLELPKGLKIKVVEDTPDAVHFVLTADYRIKGKGPQPSTASGDKRRQLIEKAWDDADFKARLLKEPKAVISAETGASFPAGAAVTVLEDTETVVHLVLPS